MSVTLGADPADRTRAAEGLDVESIATLAADVDVQPWLDGFEVRGVLRADVVRICGVSLEPFEEHVDEPVVLRFVPAGSPNAPLPPRGDVELDLEADDPPDSIAGDTVDLGAYLVEQLALALSPFPRKPGVEFEPPAASGSLSPFSVLARLASEPPDGE
jgi:uncharacterized metal-binding protein YceD (DUF177 family)